MCCWGSELELLYSIAPDFGCSVKSSGFQSECWIWGGLSELSTLQVSELSVKREGVREWAEDKPLPSPC